MNQSKHTPQYLNRRKMLLVMPVPSALVLTLLFWVGGGGKGVAETTANPGSLASGINTALPSASESTLPTNKLQAYLAPVDSFRHQGLAFASASVDSAAAPAGLNYAVQPGQSKSVADLQQADPNVAAVQQRMQNLQQQTYEPTPVPAPAYRSSSASVPEPEPDASVRQLLAMQAAYERQIAALDKPAAPTPAPTPAARVATGKATMTVVEEVKQSVVSAPLSRVPARRTPAGNSFRGLGDATSAERTTIPAVVHGDQVVSQGSVVKLRLLQDVLVEGRLVPRNTFLYGTCQVSGNRLTLEATSVQTQNSVIPLSLKAYDLDGLEGLYIPGSLNRDATKEGLADGASGADLLTMSPSLGAQAAGIALQTGKALAGQKIKLVKIHLKANYQLLLKP